MKKILKRLGIFGLLLAVLIPFLDLPVVKAATDGCDQYVNTYLFLDVFTGKDIPAYELKTVNGAENRGHRNYATFKYTFWNNAKDAVVKRVTFNKNDTTTKNYTTFDTMYKKIQNLNDTTTGTTSVDLKKIGSEISFIDTTNYKGVTFLVHGQWAEASSSNYSTTGDIFKIFTENSFDYKSTFPNSTDLQNNSIQNLVDTTFNSQMGLAKYVGSNFSYAETLDATYGDTELSNALNKNVLNNISEAKDSGKIATIAGEESIVLGINRYIKPADLAELTFAYVDDVDSPTTYYVFEGTSNKTSYETFKLYLEAYEENNNIDYTSDTYTVTKSASQIVSDSTIILNKTYYWPEAYNVIYDVCDTTSSEKVSLTYDGNTDDATLDKVPATQSYEVNEEVTVQAGASRDNYAFKKWCTEKDGTGKCFVEKDTFNITADTTLYAQWGKEGTTENGKTGIASYIIGFASVGIVASGIYLISKKKNLFKQI